jgi:hypothetical protein
VRGLVFLNFQTQVPFAEFEQRLRQVAEEDAFQASLRIRARALCGIVQR